MAIDSNLSQLRDPRLRQIFAGVAQTARVRAEKADCRTREVPYRPGMRQSYASEATPTTLASTKRMVGEQPDRPEPEWPALVPAYEEEFEAQSRRLAEAEEHATVYREQLSLF